MVDFTIIKTITVVNYQPTVIPIYLAEYPSLILDLKAYTKLHSYDLHPYPSEVSVNNYDELNDAIITTYDSQHAQILINVFLMDLTSWHFISSNFIVNRGGIIETPLVELHFGDDNNYFVLQQGFALGIHIQCLRRSLTYGDVISVVGHVETVQGGDPEPAKRFVSVPENIYLVAPSLPLPQRPRTGLILDSFPGAIAGFSLRKLIASYNGPIVRVLRADGQSADIGFDGDLLDLTHLLNFASSGTSHGNVEVLIWYDQTGQYGHLYSPEPSLFEKRPLILQYFQGAGYKIYSDVFAFRKEGIRSVVDERYRYIPCLRFPRYSYLQGRQAVNILGDTSRRLVVVAGMFPSRRKPTVEQSLCGWGGGDTPTFYGVTYSHRRGTPYLDKIYLSLGRFGVENHNILSSSLYATTHTICATYYNESRINHLSFDGGGPVGGSSSLTTEFVPETVSGPLFIGITPASVLELDRQAGEFSCYEVLLWGSSGVKTVTHWDVAIKLDMTYPTFDIWSRRYSRSNAIIDNV